MRTLLGLAFLLNFTACRTGPWDELLDGGIPPAPDLARAPDLAARDLTPPPDLVADLTMPPWCTPGSELIYVVEENQQLSRFDPVALRFTNVGRLVCPGVANDDSAFSMAVQRDGTAWVVFGSGKLFRVDLKTVRCFSTPFDPDRAGVGPFGMGFTAATPGSMDEVLHIAADPRFGDESYLATLDLQTFRVSRIGAIDGRAELTGSGDGRIWGFFPDSPGARVVELDRKTAAEGMRLAVRIPGLDRPGFAFARWGGDFWLFVYQQGISTQVHQLKPDGTIKAALTNTGRSVVGAGVSICAP